MRLPGMSRRANPWTRQGLMRSRASRLGLWSASRARTAMWSGYRLRLCIASLTRYPEEAARSRKSLSMKHKAVKFGLTGLVLAMAFAGLMYSTLAEGTEYYKHVDEVMAQPTEWYGKKLQLHGYVVPQSVFVNQRTLEYKFT